MSALIMAPPDGRLYLLHMERHRIDHWLKLVCLFKHRGEAAEACRGGKVKINGLRVKPAAVVKEGDVVEFVLGTHFRRVVVAALPETQSSKEMARTMYIVRAISFELCVSGRAATTTRRKCVPRRNSTTSPSFTTAAGFTRNPLIFTFPPRHASAASPRCLKRQ